MAQRSPGGTATIGTAVPRWNGRLGAGTACPCGCGCGVVPGVGGAVRPGAAGVMPGGAVPCLGVVVKGL